MPAASTILTPTSSAAPDLDGGVALVTGGGRGIGRLLASALAGAGARVAVVGRSRRDLDDTVDLIRSVGGTAAAATADVTDAVTLAAAVAELRTTLGPVDVLVNNAGVVGPVGPVWEVGADAWWSAMDTNVRGTLLATQLVLPEMVHRRRGRIINLTSEAGAHRWPLVSGYSVSKAAVIKLSENLAHETRRHGISVFSFHPGLLPIGMTATVASHDDDSPHFARIRQWALREIEQGRGGDPDHAVQMMVRLAAGDADALSGRHLSVHDDLDAVLARAGEVEGRDLYVMRPERLP